MHELVEQCIVIQMSGHCMQYVIQELYYFSVAVLQGGLGGGGGGGGGLHPPPQTCSAPPPGTVLGRYKISLMSSYLELGYARAT